MGYLASKQRILILGGGQSGSYLAEILLEEGYKIILVDKSIETTHAFTQKHDIPCITSDVLNPKIYEDLNLTSQDIIIAVTDKDATNMIACYIAHQYGCTQNIIRIRRPYIHKSTSITEKSKLKDSFWSTLGIKNVFNQTERVTTELLRLLQHPGAEEVIPFPETELELIAYRVKKKSLLCNRRVMALDGVSIFSDFILVGVTPANSDNNTTDKSKYNKQKFSTHQQETIIIPSHNYKISEGDLLFICGYKKQFAKIIKLFDPSLKIFFKSVFIIGNGNFATRIAKRIHKAFPKKKVCIIVATKALAYHLRETLDIKIHVILGNIHNIKPLKDEGLGEDSIFIAAEDNDDANILSCGIVKEESHARTIAIVQKNTNKHLVPVFELDTAVNPKLLLADYVLDKLERKPFDLLFAKGTNVELIELIVSNEKLQDKYIREVPSFNNAKIISIRRKKEVLIVKEDTKLQKEDHVTMLAYKDNLSQLQSVFSKDEI